MTERRRSQQDDGATQPAKQRGGVKAIRLLVARLQGFEPMMASDRLNDWNVFAKDGAGA